MSIKDKVNRVTISFRLDNEHLDKLTQLAKKEGVSPNEKAKQTLIAVLDGRQEYADFIQLELAEARDRQGQILERIAQMEQGTKESFIALFRGLGFAKTDEQARDLIEFVYNEKVSPAVKH